jgi:hypothetical protein
MGLEKGHTLYHTSLQISSAGLSPRPYCQAEEQISHWGPGKLGNKVRRLGFTVAPRKYICTTAHSGETHSVSASIRVSKGLVRSILLT